MENELHVVRIVDENRIIVSGGTSAGLRVGKLLIVCDEDFEELIDPITNESLGILGGILARIVVSEAFPKYAICTGEDRQYRGVATAMATLAGSISLGTEPLPVDPKDMQGMPGRAKKKRHIKVGDVVHRT